MSSTVRVAALIGNLLKEEGGAQQLLFDVFSNLPDDIRPAVYHMFGEATFRDDFEAAGVPVHDLDAGSRYEVRAFRRLVARLRQDRPDVLQTNSTVSGVWGRLAARLAGVPRVVSLEHTTHADLPASSRLANGITLPIADAVVCVSDAVADSLPGWERLLLRARTAVQVIHNGVDLDHFTARTDVDDGDAGPRVVGTVGRLIPAKGYGDLLRAWLRVIRAVPSARLRVVGDGPLREELESRAADLGVADAVTFTGYRPDPRPEYRRFDVAVFPSHREGFGLTAAQAMATGVPVVVSDLPALREVVGEAGVTVPRGDSGALGEAIADLLESPARRSELAEAGRARIESRFGLDRTVDRYAALYRDLAGV